jgi:hypothetical protein
LAFLKFAKAKLQKPGIKFAEWDALRRTAILPELDFQKRTARVILQEYDPSRYMLSHATIVASVDVDNASAPVGRHFVEGFEVNRPFQDYYVTPATQRFINNNNDAFERKLLMSSFKSFVGAQSYIEHVQIPELSQGRIIDAAARDIGDSVYVDILIANDLKHAALIRSIKSGQLGTLSMGCSTSSTTCTKCGNVAKDETQLCACIRYFKGQQFVDESGTPRKVAELCGHHTDPTSVRFIEASWVANPAFKGAVLRGVLSAKEVAQVENKLHMAFSKAAPAPIPGGVAKAARSLLGQGQQQQTQAPAQQQAPAEQAPAEQAAPEQGQAPAEAPAEGAPAPAPPGGEDEDPINKAVKDLSTALRDKAIEHVREEISKGGPNEVREVVDNNKQNESLIRSALVHPQWRRIARIVLSFVGKAQAKRVLQGLILQKNGGWRRVRQAGLTGREILAVSRMLDVLTKKSSMAGETRVYRTVLSVGGTAPYEDDETYLAACRQVIGRVVTGSEASKLLEKGRLYALGRS